MSRTLAAVLILLALPASAQRWVNQSYPWAFVEHHPMVEMIDDTTDKFVYGTDRGFIYLVERDRATGRLQTKAQREVWAPVKAIKVAEATGDKRNDLIVTTRRGDLFVINTDNLEDVWRLAEGYFTTIADFTVADVEGDTVPEIILLADDRLVVFAGNTETELYRSSEEFKASAVKVADVDADGQLEIVLDTGRVLDARFRQLEWEFETPFGTPMDILDLDGDGKLEIVGRTSMGDLLIIEGDERTAKFE
jgi:hypothetical protein